MQKPGYGKSLYPLIVKDTHQETRKSYLEEAV
jgi:hypothetical protein